MTTEENGHKIKDGNIRHADGIEKMANTAHQGDFEQFVRDEQIIGFHPDKLDAHIKTYKDAIAAAEGTEGISAEDLTAAKNKAFEEMKKGIKAEKGAIERVGTWTRNFDMSKSGIATNWKGSSNGVKFARGAGVAVGGAIALHGIKRTFSRDEEGNVHPVSGLLEAGAGVGTAAMSLAKRAADNHVELHL